MQVANALNNVIRILFNPKIEAFKLFDFLVVKSNETRYLAQITEIYDDKFDSSQNVAKLKIFYKISENNEVMPYDNFTPNKECEIVKIKQEEIEDFINTDKETFIFATNAKSSTSLSLQYDFFNNHPVVLADKIENASTISLNIAKKLSDKKPSVILDSTGILEHDCAKKIVLSKDVKIPLNFSTIDFVFEKCLSNATLEFQVTVGAILNEIKNFARKQPMEFIPFNTFLKVILEQYKATPYPELKLLLIQMKKYQMNDVFARYKKDVENLFKTIEKNPVTIIDVSMVESSWQKVYLEYLTDAIDNEIYLISRINDENCDVDLINKIYNKKKNIKFIPTVSYNYKKLPSLMQYSKNYVLLPSLNQRTDFLDANFALSNLISNECVIFGENTDNFLYLAKDYELVAQEKRKNYRKIALTLVNEEEQEETLKENLGEKGDYFENQKNDSQKLMEELSNLEEENSKKINQMPQEEFTEIVNPVVEEDAFEDLVETKTDETNKTVDNFDEIVTEEKPELNLETIAKEAIETDDFVKNEPSKEIQEEPDLAIIKDEVSSIQEEKQEEKAIEEDSFKDILEKQGEDKTEEKKTDDDEDVFKFIDNDDESDKKEPSKEDSNKEEVDFSDEELDFFQIAKESSEQYSQSQNQDKEDELDLSEVSNSSLDSSFENIINSSPTEKPATIDVGDNTKLDEQILEGEPSKENLPIFKEEGSSNEPKETYNVDDSVSHSKYGKGKIVKIIKYEDRQLLQIEFENSGKKLLDPKVANLKLEQ